jgi:glycine betaine/proline transport system substrate-binding protein
MRNVFKNGGLKAGIALAIAATMLAMLIPVTGCSSETKEVSVGRALWNYDIITNNIAIYALQDKGYEVKIKDIADMGMMFAGIDQGTVDLYAQAWLPDTHSSYIESAKNTVTGGDIWGGTCPYIWTIPTYVAEEYGIWSLADLKGKGDVFEGKMTGMEEGTGGTILSRNAIKTYGLEDDLEYVPSSIAAMIAELDSSYKLNKPIIVMLWRPHPIFNRLDLTMLEDPLDAFGLDTVQWAMNGDFYKNNPEIVTFMNNFLIPRDDIEAMMARNEDDGVKEDVLSREWYDQHKAVVNAWWK